jgi:nucleoside-diphosphate-sugar epimerase
MASTSYSVLVTGASGFIGQHLCRHLSALGYILVGVDIRRPDFRFPGSFYLSDIRSSTDFEAICASRSFDYIINLAAETHLTGDSLSDYSTNTVGLLNVIRCCQITGAHLLSFSTQLVLPVDLSSKSDLHVQPDTLYGYSKAIGEYIVRASSVRWTILRPTTVWGPSMSGHLRTLMHMLRRSQYIHPSLKQSFKYYSYVGNLVFQVSSLIQCSSEIHSKTFYLCDYEPIEIYNFVLDLSRSMRSSAIPILRFPQFFAYSFALFAAFLRIFGLSRPSQILSFRRIRNITTSYAKPAMMLDHLVPHLPFNYSESIFCTSAFFTTNNNSDLRQ